MIRPFRPGDPVIVTDKALVDFSDHYDPNTGFFTAGRWNEFTYPGTLERLYTREDLKAQMASYGGNPCSEIAGGPARPLWFVYDHLGARRLVDENQLMHYAEWEFVRNTKGVGLEAD